MSQTGKVTINQLKEQLRGRGLPTTGNKGELLHRLLTIDPSALDTQGSSVNQNLEEDSLEEEDPNVMEEHPERVSEPPSDTRPNGVSEDVMKELEWLRKEKNLLERELNVARRESELRSNASPVSTASCHVSVQSISDLLSVFDGTDNTFWRWKKQVELLRMTYSLDENATKVLMSSRLKGSALNWFHSKPEHVRMNVTELMEQMKIMYDHRPNRLTLRREFENRMWQSSETFSNYCHDKVVLGNRVPIDEDELLDYIVDGIPDVRLRNQTRMHRFKKTSELIEAFEKIPLYNGPSQMNRDLKAKKESRTAKPTREYSSSTQERNFRCYNCGQSGHLSTSCQKPKREKGSCFKCGSSEHQIKNCTKEDRKVATTDTMHVIQPQALNDPYIVPINYTVSDKENCKCKYTIMALIDSGSPISLLKDKYVSEGLRSTVDNDHNFSGINGSKLSILGIFKKDIEINGINLTVQFFVVPDSTMTYGALLGRDIISNPTLKITFGKTIEIVKINDVKPRDFTEQILHIDYVKEPENISKRLNIDPKVNYETECTIRKLYEKTINSENDCIPQQNEFEMSITVKHDQPISFRPRRLAFAEKEKLRAILDELMKERVIRPSSSPYASPIVLVRKKNGELRLCIDYRELNKITVKDNFPTPLIDDHIDQLKNKKYFTSLDLKNGFHHVKMAQLSIKYTSFVTPLGQFEYLRMPFGLTNAPRVFQRFINTIFEPLIRTNRILLYLDDILIATEDINEHLVILNEVFQIARQYRLKFRLDKCSFIYSEITYLGYLIDKNGIRPSAANIESIVSYPLPRSIKEVHSFVCLASYFRRFIPNFSIVAKSLYSLLKKGTKFHFGPEEHKAFEFLKKYLSEKPVLAIYSPNLETELHCDASSHGFGAILLQKQLNGTFQPVSYFSHRTTPTESKYHSFELECLAAIYAIKRFHVYLSGIKFKIITDCDSFRLTLSKQSVNPRVSRWALFLENYDYTIEHRSGKRMLHVDALSRCHGILILEANTFERVLSIRQDQDCEICKLREKLESSEDKFFELRDGLVYRKYKNNKLLFYVPETMENNVIRTCHDDLGHIGLEKVVENILRVYWFPHVREKVKAYIANCLKCIEFSAVSGKHEGYLHSIPKGNLPFNTVHIDHYGPLEKTGKGFKYLLSVVDAFTKFIRLYPCKSTKSEESVRCLKDYFCAYSKPRRLISDRGTCFTSKVFSEFMQTEGIEHVKIAVGTPRANGQVERFNRVITAMLAKLSETPQKWDREIRKVEFALNNTVCRSTGETPSKLMFGIEQKGNTNDCIRMILDTYSENDRDLISIRKRAEESMTKVQQSNEEYYNSKRKAASVYNVGDLVVIRNVDVTLGVNKKLIPKYKGPYVVKKVLNFDRYIVSDIEGFQLTQIPFTGTVGPDQMKLWIH